MFGFRKKKPYNLRCSLDGRFKAQGKTCDVLYDFPASGRVLCFTGLCGKCKFAVREKIPVL